MDGLILFCYVLLKIYLMIKLPKILIKEPIFDLPKWRREYVRPKKGGKTNRDKYYMREIPKGMSEIVYRHNAIRKIESNNQKAIAEYYAKKNIKTISINKNQSNAKYYINKKPNGMIKDEFILIDEVKSGIDYENFCFQQLKNAGYQVSKTPEIGDQGVDLIVSANNKKCAIQCKYYSTPVGNKAVQEVIAGRGFYNCELGMVCSNNTYTKSARELASNQHIVLVEKNNIIQAVNRLLGPIRTPSSKKIAYRQNNVLREIENNNQKSIAEYYKNKKSANNRNNNH